MRSLILFPGALGDLCVLASAIARLAARGAAIEVSVQRQLAPIVDVLLPDVRLGPPVDGAAMASLFAEALAPELHSWLHGADRVDAWLGRSAVADRVRTHLATASDGAVRLHAVPRDDGAPHVLAEYLAALDAMALPAVPLAPAVRASTVWRGVRASRLLLQPGAGTRAKRWPVEGFRRVADARARGGDEVVILLGPAEAGDAAYWQASGHRIVRDAGLDEVAALVGGAAAYVGNDSGVSHLAGALARCGVVLFGPTRSERWRPLGGALVPVRFADRVLADVEEDVLACLRGSYLDTPYLGH
jgi:ADP-heptose:LPS heptosyltransferase